MMVVFISFPYSKRTISRAGFNRRKTFDLFVVLLDEAVTKTDSLLRALMESRLILPCSRVPCTSGTEQTAANTDS